MGGCAVADTGRPTTLAEREPDLPDGGVYVIERRRAARRVARLSRERDCALVEARLGVTVDQRANAGRRADDLQDEVFAVREQYPDMTLAETMTPTELWMEHKGWDR